MEAAGIEYRDSAGRVFDFHSLRAQFVTELIRSGANAKTAQLLARHSTAALTLNRYAKMQAVDLVSAVEGLPNVPVPRSEQPGELLRATGTTGLIAENVAGPVAGNVAVSVISPCPESSHNVLDSAIDSSLTKVETSVFPRVSDASRPAVSQDDLERRWSELNRRWRICNPLP